jgi:hypothetical protein
MKQGRLAELLARVVSSPTPRACGRSRAALSLEKDDRIASPPLLLRCAE